MIVSLEALGTNVNNRYAMCSESERVTPVDSIKDIVRSFVKVPEFDKHRKKAGGHINRNVV